MGMMGEQKQALILTLLQQFHTHIKRQFHTCEENQWKTRKKQSFRSRIRLEGKITKSPRFRITIGEGPL